MENDSVRTIGDSTLVDIWLSGKLRSVSVSRGAIADFKGFPLGQAASMSEDERSEFVRTNLTLIAAAAAARLKDDPGADSVTVESGQLRREDSRPADDRRHGSDRRKGDRRKVNRGPPGAERRRS